MFHDEVDIDIDRLRWEISRLLEGRHASLAVGDLGVHRLGEVIYVESPGGELLGEIPLWQVRHYASRRLAEVWSRVCEVAGLSDAEARGAVPIAPPDSDWVTISTATGGDLPVHRSSIVDGWPQLEPVLDPPELTSALVTGLR